MTAGPFPVATVTGQPESTLAEPDEPRDIPRWIPLLAGALSLSAAVAHATLIAEHLQQWWGFGTFFIAVTLGQAALAVMLWRISRGRTHPRAVLAGILGTVTVIGVYLISRTIGIPIGPPEAVHESPPDTSAGHAAGLIGPTSPTAQTGRPDYAAQLPSTPAEGVGALDLLALVNELGLLVLLVYLLAPRLRARSLNVLAMAGAAAWAGIWLLPLIQN